MSNKPPIRPGAEVLVKLTVNAINNDGTIVVGDWLTVGRDKILGISKVPFEPGDPVHVYDEDGGGYHKGEVVGHLRDRPAIIVRINHEYLIEVSDDQVWWDD